MDIAEALKLIQDSNELVNRSAIYAAIAGRIETLEEEKKGIILEKDKLRDNNAELLKQKNQASRKVDSLQKTLDEILADAGINPADDDGKKLEAIKSLKAKTSELEAQLESATKDKDKEIEVLKEQILSLEGRATVAEKTVKVQAIASKLKVDPGALSQVIDWTQTPVDVLAISDEKITVKDGDKFYDLSDYLKEKNPFLANALFATTSKTESLPAENNSNPGTGDDGEIKPPEGDSSQSDNNGNKPQSSNAGNQSKPSAPPGNPPKESMVKKYLATARVRVPQNHSK